jgi:hypothetical protein
MRWACMRAVLERRPTEWSVHAGWRGMADLAECMAWNACRMCCSVGVLCRTTSRSGMRRCMRGCGTPQWTRRQRWRHHRRGALLRMGHASVLSLATHASAGCGSSSARCVVVAVPATLASAGCGVAAVSQDAELLPQRGSSTRNWSSGSAVLPLASEYFPTPKSGVFGLYLLLDLSPPGLCPCAGVLIRARV